MKITLEMIRQNGLCLSDYKQYFITSDDFLSGIGYQKLLDKCVNNNDEWSATWLLSAFGFTNEITLINSNYKTDTSIIIAGNLIVNGAIKSNKRIIVGGSLKSGWSIQAGEEIDVYGGIEAEDDIMSGYFIKVYESVKSNGNIISGWDIVAGNSIEANGNIFAGKGCGVIAGQIFEDGVVVAKERPVNLICDKFKKR